MVRKILISCIFIFSIFYIAQNGFPNSPFKMVFKLLPMLFIILLALQSKAFHMKKYYVLMSIGLIICAIGDYTIQWFIIGLTFFLIGHLFYIAAFLSTNKNKPPRIFILILIIYSVTIGIIIAGDLFTSKEIILAFAVLCYISVILVMAISSWRTNNLYAIIGALLFLVSDSILALNKFTVAIPYSTIWIMSTYYAAQFLFALSIANYSAIRNKVVQ